MTRWRFIGTLAAASVVLWLSFTVRVWDLNSESIWHDEGWSIRAIQDPIDTPDDNTPYVYYVALHVLWQTGIGNTPFAFRFGSVLIGMITVAIALRIGRQWFAVQGAIAVGILVAISPLLWEYAQEVRAYVAVPLIALILLGLLQHMLAYTNDAIPRWLWASVLSTEIIGLYTHNLVVAVVAWASVAVGVVWLIRKDWQRLLSWGALHIGLLLAYVPWLLTQSPSGTALNTAPDPDFELLLNIWYSYFLPILAQVQSIDTHTMLNVLAGITIMAALALMTSKRAVLAWLLTSNVIIVPVFSTAILLAASIDFHPRYYIAAVPGTLLLLVGGIDAALSMVRPSNILHSIGLSGLVVLAGVIAWQSVHDIRNTRTYQHDDFAGLARYYASLPADAVILIPFDDEPALQHYFAAEYDIQAQFVNVPLYSDENAVIDAIASLLTATPRHVEFLTWFQLPADVRGMYPCLLAASSNNVGEVQSFFGLSTQAFSLVQSPALATIATDQPYSIATLTDLSYAGGTNGVCLRAKWDIAQPVEQLSTTAQVLAPDIDWTIARTDSMIRDREQIAEHDIHATASSYHWLEMPSAAPQQPYPVAVTLYSPQMASGYDVVIDNQIVGKQFFVPTPIVAVGPPLTDGLSASQLVQDSLDSNLIDSGQSLQAEVLLHTNGHPIILRGEGWQLEYAVSKRDDVQRVWSRFTIPPDATGLAELFAGDTLLATYQINAVERIYEVPAIENAVSTTFGGFARLVGFNVENPLDITLIWQAQSNTPTAYTAFVQLLAPDGRVIAQSDQQPASNQRPTTGWVADEYIIDNHPLTLNVDSYEGPVNVIVGFYDSQRFVRVTTMETGQDYFQLPVNLILK